MELPESVSAGAPSSCDVSEIPPEMLPSESYGSSGAAADATKASFIKTSVTDVSYSNFSCIKANCSGPTLAGVRSHVSSSCVSGGTSEASGWSDSSGSDWCPSGEPPSRNAIWCGFSFKMCFCCWRSGVPHKDGSAWCGWISSSCNTGCRVTLRHMGRCSPKTTMVRSLKCNSTLHRAISLGPTRPGQDAAAPSTSEIRSQVGWPCVKHGYR